MCLLESRKYNIIAVIDQKTLNVRASARLLWDYWYAVPAVKNIKLVPTLSQPVQSTLPRPNITMCPRVWSHLFLSVCVCATDIWSRSSFQVMTFPFLSADVGKTVDHVSPLQTVIKHLLLILASFAIYSWWLWWFSQLFQWFLWLKWMMIRFGWVGQEK